MAKSVHDELQMVRKPRVHIRYDVETLGAEKGVELPFVVGVLGDFSGNDPDPDKEHPSLAQRKFIDIDRDNLNGVMKRFEPRVAFKVDNKLKGDGTQFGVQLQFNSMDDFEPAAIVQQVEPLKKLLETRQKLVELITQVDRSEKMEKLLEDILQNTEQMEQIKKESGDASADANEEGGE